MTISLALMSDEELSLLAGESEVFSELESRYLTFIGSLVRKFSSYDVEAEDLTQAALIGLSDACRNYKKEKGASFRTFAAVCITNRLKNEVRDHSANKNIPLNTSVSIEELKNSPSDIASPEDILETRENFEAVLNQIHISLSDFERKVLVLVLSGYNRREGAEKLSIPQKAFDNALQRIRRKLKANSSIR